MATVDWMDSKYKRYNWQGLSELDTLTAKVSARCMLSLMHVSMWYRTMAAHTFNPAACYAASRAPAESADCKSLTALALPAQLCVDAAGCRHSSVLMPSAAGLHFMTAAEASFLPISLLRPACGCSGREPTSLRRSADALPPPLRLGPSLGPSHRRVRHARTRRLRRPPSVAPFFPKNQARRSVAQLLPYSWTRLEWMVFKSERGAGASAGRFMGLWARTTPQHLPPQRRRRPSLLPTPRPRGSGCNAVPATCGPTPPRFRF